MHNLVRIRSLVRPLKPQVPGCHKSAEMDFVFNDHSVIEEFTKHMREPDARPELEVAPMTEAPRGNVPQVRVCGGWSDLHLPVHPQPAAAENPRRGIASGSLLKEASVATHLGVSRAPVRRALVMLEEIGLVSPAAGQGYVVGDETIRRLSPRDLHDLLAPATEEIDRTATWERIFARVSHEIMSLMPFGTYRIQEAELGDYHHVSRTVAREVLWRLMDARLIEKDRKSHWIVGQMTARDVRDSLEMRQVLEPKALAHVANGMDRAWLERLIAQVDNAITTFPVCGGERGRCDRRRHVPHDV